MYPLERRLVGGHRQDRQETHGCRCLRRCPGRQCRRWVGRVCQRQVGDEPTGLGDEDGGEARAVPERFTQVESCSGDNRDAFDSGYRRQQGEPPGDTVALVLQGEHQLGAWSGRVDH